MRAPNLSQNPKNDIKKIDFVGLRAPVQYVLCRQAGFALQGVISASGSLKGDYTDRLLKRL
jgi:hypothetical protein